MARLPIVGSDDNDWGTILNEFLQVSHNTDGSLQASAVTNSGGITTPSGTAGGDLSGTYPNPSVAALNGVAVNGTPAAGQVLTASGSAAAGWAAAGDSVPSATLPPWIQTGTGTPVDNVTPNQIGAVYVDTANGESQYIANGLTSADWVGTGVGWESDTILPSPAGSQYIVGSEAATTTGNAVGWMPFARANGGKAVGIMPMAVSQDGEVIGSQPTSITLNGFAVGANPIAITTSGPAVGSIPYASTNSGTAIGVQPIVAVNAGSGDAIAILVQYMFQSGSGKAIGYDGGGYPIRNLTFDPSIVFVTSQSGPPNPLTTYVTPMVYDTTSVTGGLYAWDGTTYIHVSNVAT